jgi:hypothetical protein
LKDGSGGSPPKPKSSKAQSSEDEGDTDEEEEEEDGDDGEDEEGDEDEDDEGEEEEPKLKYARLTPHLGPVYRNGDATSAFFVGGDKMVWMPSPYGHACSSSILTCQ